MSYAVYEVGFGEDNTSHGGIFVLTDFGSVGRLYDVRGSLEAPGQLVFQDTEETLDRFRAQSFLGMVKATDLPRLKSICEGVAPPTEKFKPGKEAHDMPQCNCPEWSVRAVQAIVDAGILSQ